MNRKVEWYPIRGYEGLYEISDTGRVRSLRRAVPVFRNGVKYMMTLQARKIKVRLQTGKYPVVTLCKGGIMHPHYISHLLEQNVK